jgi:hypothetical protein
MESNRSQIYLIISLVILTTMLIGLGIRVGLLGPRHPLPEDLPIPYVGAPSGREPAIRRVKCPP